MESIVKGTFLTEVTGCNCYNDWNCSCNYGDNCPAKYWVVDED